MSRKTKHQKNIKRLTTLLSALSLGVVLILVGITHFGKATIKQVEKATVEVALAETLEPQKLETKESSSEETVEVSETATESAVEATVAQATEVAESVDIQETVTEAVQAEVVETVASTYDTATYATETYVAAPAVATTSYTTSTTTLSNGNTAGEIGSYAAAQMAAATGVSQETWEYIIARESNGDPSAANASGASGLFQTIPGWGSTATVEDQIQSALNAYNSQGLAAWGY